MAQNSRDSVGKKKKKLKLNPQIPHRPRGRHLGESRLRRVRPHRVPEALPEKNPGAGRGQCRSKF